MNTPITKDTLLAKGWEFEGLNHFTYSSYDDFELHQDSYDGQWRLTYHDYDDEDRNYYRSTIVDSMEELMEWVVK